MNFKDLTKEQIDRLLSECGTDPNIPIEELLKLPSDDHEKDINDIKMVRCSNNISDYL